MSFPCSCRLCVHWRIGAQNRKWCNCPLVAEHTLTAKSLAHKTSLSGGGMGLAMSCGPENKHRDTFTHRANISTMLSLFLSLATFASKMLLFLPEMTNHILPCPHSSVPFLPPSFTLFTLSHTFSDLISPLQSFIFLFLLYLPVSQAKIDSLRSKVDLLRLPLALSSKSISNHKNHLPVGLDKGGSVLGVGGAMKPRPLPASDMDNESMYSVYSYKSSYSRSSRKHR